MNLLLETLLFAYFSAFCFIFYCTGSWILVHRYVFLLILLVKVWRITEFFHFTFQLISTSLQDSKTFIVQEKQKLSTYRNGHTRCVKAKWKQAMFPFQTLISNSELGNNRVWRVALTSDLHWRAPVTVNSQPLRQQSGVSSTSSAIVPRIWTTRMCGPDADDHSCMDMGTWQNTYSSYK